MVEARHAHGIDGASRIPQDRVPRRRARSAWASRGLSGGGHGRRARDRPRCPVVFSAIAPPVLPAGTAFSQVFHSGDCSPFPIGLAAVPGTVRASVHLRFLGSLEDGMKLRLVLAAGAVAALGASIASPATVQSHQARSGRPAVRASAQSGIQKIKHIIVILQENRTFDSYFGTYPGADGIPPGVCVPDPFRGGCVKPFVDHGDSNRGGPHMDKAFTADVDAV